MGELRIGLFKKSDDIDVFIKRFGGEAQIIKVYLKEDSKDLIIEVDLLNRKIKVIRDKETLEKDLEDKELRAFKTSF